VFRPTRIQAEDFSIIENGRPVDLANGEGRGVSRLSNNSYLIYDDIDLSGVIRIKVRCASTEPVEMEFRQGSPNGNLVASGVLNELSGDFSVLEMSVTGQSNELTDLYLVFRYDDDFERKLFVDWMEFELVD